ncbi:MAG: anhydro-N-acetylmuramic acid kinase [Pseudomonadota bacterium]|uniref:anhydro-N-acetylmuramic acid kinase n=1 Tax=Fodinicurvata fenggangensis TaxID=1121830 RepID=UPI000479DEEE|nr:anhydro-N-acetylmuramic acid kinase [Fodinicurvata fenggangensis]
MEILIGLMSGTSLDGVDVAAIETDGRSRVRSLCFESLAYSDAFRDRMRQLLKEPDDPSATEVERDLTLQHAEAVERLLERSGLPRKAVRAIGFHGQTIRHDPSKRYTWQMGDGALLSRIVGIDVVTDFRSADVRAGGQGAPLAPLYHAVKSVDLTKPLAILNLGGVGNVTWVGPDREAILAFDTGPGNALIDDWVYRATGRACDLGGEFAERGRMDPCVLAELLTHSYFEEKPPKSLDRNSFSFSNLEELSLEDGAATLTAFTAAAVGRGQAFFPLEATRWLVCGGGRHNPAIMKALAGELTGSVEPVESVGWNGDALEAECFAYLASRSLQGLPISLPLTTGVPHAMRGGRLFAAGV